MKTKYPIFEFLIGWLIIMAIALIFHATCHAQGYDIPLKKEYSAQDIQNKFDHLWIFIASLNVSDVGTGEFDTLLNFDTVFTNFKFDTIFYVDFVLDSCRSDLGQNQAWTDILSDSSVVIHRNRVGSPDAQQFRAYHWLVVGRLKKP